MERKGLKYRRLAYRPWPVTVTIQECDEATAAVADIEATFVAHFKPFTEADLLRVRRRVFGDESDDDIRKAIAEMPAAEFAEKETELFAELICGWGHMTDDTGAAIAYDAAALHMVCCGPDGPAFRRGINRAISEIRYGVAPAKNAGTSPSPGPTPGGGEAATSLPPT